MEDDHIEIDVPKEVSEEWKELEKVLSELMKEAKPRRLHLVNEIFRSAIKLARENPGTLNLKITSTALKELRYSFKMFTPNKDVPKITMFGSARTPPTDPLYAFARDFAAEAVKRKYMIITGGGPGIMAGGNEGAGKRGFGLNIRLPFEQSANPFIEEKDHLIHYKYFFTRKLFLVKQASAFAFFPGGFGTFDEAFEVLTLLQTGKSNLIPVVLAEPKGFGFWDAMQKFLDHEVMGRGFISPPDRALYRAFHTPKDAMDHIELFYKNYHSMRFVKDRVVIRLKKKLPAEVMTKMQRQFGHLAMNQKFHQSGALEEEGNEPELKTLTRLVFPFDRKDFAGLRLLIDFINENTI